VRSNLKPKRLPCQGLSLKTSALRPPSGCLRLAPAAGEHPHGGKVPGQDWPLRLYIVHDKGKGEKGTYPLAQGRRRRRVLVALPRAIELARHFPKKGSAAAAPPEGISAGRAAKESRSRVFDGPYGLYVKQGSELAVAARRQHGRHDHHPRKRLPCWRPRPHRQKANGHRPAKPATRQEKEKR